MNAGDKWAPAPIVTAVCRTCGATPAVRLNDDPLCADHFGPALDGVLNVLREVVRDAFTSSATAGLVVVVDAERVTRP